MLIMIIQNTMKFTYDDLQKMQREAPIKNGVLTFDETTRNIQFLSITDNEKLTEIRFTAPQPNLRYLDFGRCKIEKVVFSQYCENLEAVYLEGNQLTTFKIEVDLPALALLDLSRNEKLSDITLNSGLPNLKYLYLTGCDLIDLSIFSRYFTSEGFDFHIAKNENLKTPPPEIVSQGKEAVVNYFKSLEGETKSLNEIKVILVGEGKAGKTSLLKRTKGEPFDENESQTHGVNIENWPCEKINVHFWDFGGQEIMHATHQFFLSERSIYILVIDARNDDETKVEYWLKHITTFGGNSQIVLVINKIDENPTFDLSRSKLNEKYPVIGNRFFRVSCKSGEGIPAFIEGLRKLIPKSEMINTPLAVNWLMIKKLLEKETADEKYLDKKRFIKICEENGVKDDSTRETLIQFLHDLGIVLHFKDLDLQNFFVLDPFWVTIGAYKIVNSKLVADNCGIINENQVEYILNKEEEKQQEYKSDKKKNFKYEGDEPRFIIDLMQQFELCYKNSKGVIFVADQLKKDQPDDLKTFKNEDALKFVFKYDFLPKTIIKRLIVQLFQDIIKKDGNLLVWRNGLLLRNQKADAAVVADDNEKSITVFVKGEENRRRDYFSTVYNHISAINVDIKNLIVTEFIPLPGYPENEIEYAELLGYEKAGYPEILIGKLGIKFSVSKLLNGYTIKNTKRMEKDHISISINNPITIGDITSSSSSSSKSHAKATNEISISVNYILGETENLKDDIERELKIKKVPEEEIELAKSDIEVFEKAIKESEEAINNNQSLPAKTESRLRSFWDDIVDENSNLHKALKMIRRGKDYAVKLAKLYNNVPGVPSIPPLALEIIEKL